MRFVKHFLKIFLLIFGKPVNEVKILKNARFLGLFALGGSAYVGMELLWRGRSHPSMFAAGGLCFLLLGKLRETRLPDPMKPMAGAGIITAVELGTGLFVNRDYRVWDYRRLPMNYRGQICLPFSLLWVPVSMLGMALYGLAEKIWESR